MTRLTPATLVAPRQARPSAGPWRWIAWTCLLTAVVCAVPGCSGCRQDPLVKRKKELDDIDKKKKKKELTKEDFEIRSAQVVPGQPNQPRKLVKPLHWVTVAHEVKANNFNFQAQLHTATTDSQGRPFDVRNTLYQLESSCPAPLPKGQNRRFETTYFIPSTGILDKKQMWLNRELRSARGGRLVGQPDRVGINPMPGYQYHMVVLASDPDRYGYLKRLTSVAAPTSRDIVTGVHLYYQVVLPKIDKVAPLPSHSLTWTSIAYLLWDDVPPTILTPDQQQAMLDWLHWGGQLIISGPNTLDKLKGSFLDPYLPAVSTETVELDPAAISELDQAWSIKEQNTGEPRSLNTSPANPLIGVILRDREQAKKLPGTGGLVVERRVGQGRIVTTAFSLSDRVLLTWGSFDSFYNACLFRRPSRVFKSDQDFQVDSYWADFAPAYARDSRLVTSLRYFSRDIGHFAVAEQGGLGVQPEDRQFVNDVDNVQEADEQDRILSRLPDPDTTNWHLSGFPKRIKFGIAAWNSTSGAADAARESLKDAAGISIPKGDFVLRVLGVYLLVLAPLNWGFFRLLGRVELAWLAAPLIAIVGAFAVIRLAQLDIGFARSVTEVAIAEVHSDYPRAHVTRYSALYTSLSTGYQLVFDDTSSVAQPFGRASDFSRGPHDPTYLVNLERDRKVNLSGFRVPSNKTGIVHCEQMCDLGGTIQWNDSESGSPRVVNGSNFNLHGVGILRRHEQGQLEAAWVGELGSKQTVAAQFSTINQNAIGFKEWEQDSVTSSYEDQARQILTKYDLDRNGRLEKEEAASDEALAFTFDRLDLDRDEKWSPDELRRWCRESRAGELSLGQMIELAARGTKMRPGEVRLIGWTEQQMPELEIQPAAAQITSRVLFLVHLRKGRLSVPYPDQNAFMDVAKPLIPGEQNTEANSPSAPIERP